MSHNVSLVASDGHSLNAYFAGDPNSPRALIVIQEIFGVNRHIRSVADRYSALGYAVIAPALFDRVERGVELDYAPEIVERARAIATKLDPAKILLDIAAALTFAREQSRPVGLVGYCLGGSYAWLSATRLPSPPDATVGYYGSRVAATADEQPKVPVLLHFGENDKGIPLTDVEKIRTAHPNLPVYTYPAGHAFNRDGSAAYHEPSATLAFERTRDFFAQHLGAPRTA